MQLTQLILSFYPSDFHSNIIHLQNALQQISSWMTASLLTLNSSKTEFLFTERKQQLSEIHNTSLTTTHTARNLGFIFDEQLTFSDQITALFKPNYLHNLMSLQPPRSTRSSSVNPYLSSSPLSASITPSFFHLRLKTYIINKCFPL